MPNSPSASCRNHSGQIPLRPDVIPSGNRCEAGMPSSGYLTQRQHGWTHHKPCAREWSHQAFRRRKVEMHWKYPALGPSSLCHPLKPEFGYSRKRVRRQMQLAVIASAKHRTCKVITNVRRSRSVAPDLPKRNLFSEQANQAWAGDIITCIPTEEGRLCPAIVKGLCTHKIVGYAFSSDVSGSLA